MICPPDTPGRNRSSSSSSFSFSNWFLFFTVISVIDNFFFFFIYPSDSSKSQSQSLNLLLSISICDQVTSLVMVSDLFFFFFSMITLIATFPSVFIDFLQRGSDQTTDLCLYGSVFFFLLVNFGYKVSIFCRFLI